MKTTLEILKEARELLSDPARWTKGTFARAVDGLPARLISPAACSFCAAGAIYRAGDLSDLGPEAADLFADIIDPMPDFQEETCDRIGGWNDRPDRTHDEVVAAFDAAILRGRT